MPSKAPSLVFIALCIIWGSTWLGIKVGLEFLPPFLFAGFRFVISTFTLLILAKVLHAQMPRDRSSWTVMLFLGVVQVSLPYGLVFWGEEYISSGLSAVLFSTLPFFVAMFAHVIANERLTETQDLRDRTLLCRSHCYLLERCYCSSKLHGAEFIVR